MGQTRKSAGQHIDYILCQSRRSAKPVRDKEWTEYVVLQRNNRFEIERDQCEVVDNKIHFRKSSQRKPADGASVAIVVSVRLIGTVMLRMHVGVVDVGGLEDKRKREYSQKQPYPTYPASFLPFHHSKRKYSNYLTIPSIRLLNSISSALPVCLVSSSESLTAYLKGWV